MSKSSNLPKLDVIDVPKVFAGLASKSHRLQDGFVQLGLEYTNKIVGKFISEESKTLFLLRDAIFFRLSALTFHLRLLVDVQSFHLKKLQDLEINSKDSQLFLLDGREQQIFLFDSLVFHSISLFDYVGNLIDYLCGQKKQMNLKWNGIVRSSRDTKNPISQFAIAPTIVSVNNSFVAPLYGHRSDLIHYKTDLGGAQTSFDLMTAKADFIVFAPRRFVSTFSPLRKLSETQSLTLGYVAFWLCDQSLDNLGILLGKLLDHLEATRKVPKGKEVFLFGVPPKPSS